MKNRDKSNWKPALPGLIAFILLAAILIYPKESYQAALSGLNIFLQSVFPALLPFFIASEIMSGLGVVDFLSVLLNPLMSPLFRCPGSSSFIWVMSMTSGYPAGARLTAMFHKEKRITADEAQRILSFCSTSGPLFMMGAVAVGMMGTGEGGLVILLSHYCAAVLLGLSFRFYRSRGYRPRREGAGLKEAVSALNEARKRDGRPLGQIMGDSVRNSVNVLLVVGGFIMLFSVIIDLLMRSGIIDHLASLAAAPLKPLSVDEQLIKAVTGGLLEVTTGCRLVSEAAVSMLAKIAGASFLIGWSGLSIHAQAASLLSGTGVRISLYMFGKLLHGLLAAVISIPLTLLLYPRALEVSTPVPVVLPGWKEGFIVSLRLLAAACLVLVLLAAAARIRLRRHKKRQL